MNSLWAQRNKRERMLILLCAVTVVVAVVLLLTPPSKGARALLPAAEARQKDRLVNAQQRSVTADTVALKAKLAATTYTDPAEMVVPQVIRSLQGYAAQSGVHLREIKPMRMHKMQGVVRVPLTVRFTSGFGNTIPFLYRVEDPSGKLVVERLTVTASDPKTRQVDVETQVAFFTTYGALMPTTGGAKTPSAGAGAKQPEAS